MGLKYFSRFTNVDGGGREVRFFNDAFDGAPTEWLNSAGAVDYDEGDSDSVFPDQPIIATQAQIGLILTELYDLSEFVFDRKTFFVQIVDTDIDKVKWSGWIEPWNAAHKYVDPPHEVSLTASCGLAHLSRKKYVNPSNSFRKTGLAIIQECLSIIEAGDLALRLSTHMVENSFSGDAVLGLTSFEIDTQRYYDDNGEAMYCDVIVNDILNHFDAELAQWDNKWVIRAVVDHATATATDFHDIGDTSGSLPWPGTYIINSSQAKSLVDGQIRVLAPITKYRTEIDFGQQTPFFENGNMLLWNENGLIGWDFSHMSKGNPGWEQFALGGESNKSVLKINGKSPQPYRKRKKVSLFKKLTNQAINIAIAGTGAVGALFNKPVLKGTWYDVEPSEWIESPGGSISKADKSVTITFEYETEAFSSDILISIRIPVTLNNGEVRNFWVDPNSNPAQAGSDKTNWSADDKFHLIRVKPVDRGSLINKGEINASGNPNYPAAGTANWTWTITGVPAGEYRKIGGINGVSVENGDLIIARVPNAGGSQEDVGENFEIVSIRNKTHKGTFSGTIGLSSTFIATTPDAPYPDKVYVRFYKMADDEGFPGDWYKIYNLNGALEGFVPSTESSKYATTLERGSKTDEEAETIQLITGDYTPWYMGSWRKPGSNDLTSSWKRRPFLNEGMSIYRAMMLDRLCMTSRPLDVFEGEIKLLPNQPDLSYFHTLVFADQGGKKFRIVRYSFNEYKRIANITAVEIKYEEIPQGELRQDSYIPGSHQLNTIPGQGDGIYPSKQDSTNGRLNAEDMPLTGEEILEAVQAVGRAAALFEDIDPLTYVAGVESEDSVDLKEFISEAFVEDEEEFEPEDRFDITTLVLKLASKPSWVTELDDENLVITATALAPKSGSFYIDYYGYDPEDTEFEDPILIRIPVLVEENEDFAETWPPEFDPFPVLNFVLKKETVTGFNFRDYITSGHKFLKYRFFSLPDWISDRTVVNDDFSITGTAPIIEKRRITVEIWDGIAEHRPYTDEIEIQVIEPTEITGELMDIASGDSKVGDLPGAFEVLEKWDIPISVTGLHDKVIIKVTGGGDLGDEVNVTKTFPLSEPAEEGVYRPFSDIGGSTDGVGQYLVETTAFLGENETIQTFDLTFYDDAYLLKMRKFLVKGFTSVGEIMPDGKTSFLYPGPVNARAEIHDIPFDEIYYSLEKDGEVIGEKHLTDVNWTITWWFPVFEEDTILEPGVYTFPVRLLNEGVDVFKRTDKFTIEDKEAEPKPLLSLATFAPGTTNVSIIAEGIPLKGAEYDLVPWTIVFNGFGPGVECVTGEWEFMFERGGAFAEVDVEQFTGYPQKFAYTSGKTLIFGNKSSLKIGDIHQAPSRVLVKFFGRDASGKVVGVAQADFSFRVALDSGDYSGFAFFEDNIASGVGTLIDGNMPIEGRKYLLPAEGKTWSVRRRSFDGNEFSVVEVWVQKDVSGSWVTRANVITLPGTTSDVGDYETVKTEWELSGGRPIVKNSTQPIYIDEVGIYRVIMFIVIEGSNHGWQTTFELIEDVEPPIKDCCACDCEGSGEWNGGESPEW